ncbi:unnamed protein product [Phytophthora fragariaefolia]|uniref:Unnamed protein product n=1 Tax=Phytophthora fragariaefolia TaxID=1490495 RepID=A0A9W6X2M3_9STRA|nr:unnamed protein product [Phytophthora fragariaefolia]
MLQGPDSLSIYSMPRPPAKASTVGVSGNQAATAQTQSGTHIQRLKEEAELQQMQMQQLQQVQHQQQYQLQQQAQMQMQMQQQQLQQQQQQQQQQQLQYTQGMVAASGALAQNAAANSLVSAAVQAATNAANAAATAGGATAGGGYAFPRNSPEFACENVGERVKGKRRKYCPHEVTALVLGVQRYADDSCPWSSILRDPHLGHLFHGRSGVDLKDKWRTLIKTRPELAAYTENRKNHRKYRPFSATEERALLEGVKKYNGQRNVWSLILIDKELGPQFNDRSNVQLKDKFRTMRRAGATSSLLVSGGGAAGTTSRRTSAASTPTSDGAATTGTSTATSASTTRTLTPTSTAVLTTAVSAAVNGSSRVPATVTSASQQAATLLVQNSNAASAMFADPNLYLAGSFSLQSHLSQGMSMPQMTTTQSRQATATANLQAQAHAQAHAQAQAQAHAQAQAIANAQARAAQVQLEAQMQHMQAHGGQQATIKAQYQALNAQGRYNAGISGYQLVGNQIVPQQALYYPTSQIAQSQQQAHIQQQQLQQQLQQRQLQQQQQQQLAAAIAAAANSQSSQQQKSQSTSSGLSSGTSRGASGSGRGGGRVRGRNAKAQADKRADANSMKVEELASSSVEDLLLHEANAHSAAASASAGDTSSTGKFAIRVSSSLRYEQGSYNLSGVANRCRTHTYHLVQRLASSEQTV